MMIDTKILKIDPSYIDDNKIAEAAGFLKNNHLVAFPTETVYGIGANIFHESAIKAIFTAKGRPQDNPLIIHIYDISQLEILVDHITSSAQTLIDRFWPGPLTIIFKKHRNIPLYVTSGLETIAVRMPSHPIATELLRAAGIPIAAPSANLSGKPSPTMAEHVIKDLTGKVDIILDGGNTTIGLESTVVDTTCGYPTILRPGGITREAIKDLFGGSRISLNFYAESNKKDSIHGESSLNSAFQDDKADANEKKHPKAPKSPGVKYTHYAPEARMILFKGQQLKTAHWLNKVLENIASARNNLNRSPDIGIIASDELLALIQPHKNAISLGTIHNPELAAEKLFRAFRELDQRKVSMIFTEYYPANGLGLALQDRMSKAASGHIMDIERISSVLFVCTGNTCRSSMAEAFFNTDAATVFTSNRMAEDFSPVIKEYPVPHASSAGVAAFPGDPASAESILVLKEDWDIDLSAHRSRTLSPYLLEASDLIFTMTARHRNAILSHFPDLFYKVFVLQDFVRTANTASSADSDIIDPFGGNLRVYRVCANEIRQAVHTLLLLLKNSS